MPNTKIDHSSGMRTIELLHRLQAVLRPLFDRHDAELCLITSSDVAMAATLQRQLVVNPAGIHVDVLLHVPARLWLPLYGVLARLNVEIWRGTSGRHPDRASPSITRRRSGAPLFVQAIDPAKSYGGKQGLAGMELYVSKRYAKMAKIVIGMVLTGSASACAISPVMIIGCRIIEE